MLEGCGKPTKKPSRYFTEPELAAHILAVRNLIHELAREDISNEVLELRIGNHSDIDRTLHKEHILKKLKIISPGESCQINSIIDHEGSIHSDPKEVAKILTNHWSKVFSNSDSDDELLNKWMDSRFTEQGHNKWKTGLPPSDPGSWKVKKKHVKKAIAFAKSSMPGPDGIPASAYKALGDLAVDVLHWVFEALSSDEAESMLCEAHKSMTMSEQHEFNKSILCCLPQKTIWL